MPDTEDTNAAVWKSDIGVSFWKSRDYDRTARDRERRTLMAELLPFAPDEPFTFVDLGAGTGAAARMILDHYTAANAILADFSPQMMAQGEVELAPYAGRYSYVEFDLTAEDSWPEAIPPRVNAVISSLSVHHLKDARKQTLFAEVFGRLVPGGWYLNYDPVTPADPVVEEAWLRAGDRRDPTAEEKRNNRTPEEQFRYENHVRYMIPLDPQVGFLRAAGFEGVDVFWKELDFVIYGGRRPLLSASSRMLFSPGGYGETTAVPPRCRAGVTPGVAPGGADRKDRDRISPARRDENPQSSIPPNPSVPGRKKGPRPRRKPPGRSARAPGPRRKLPGAQCQGPRPGRRPLGAVAEEPGHAVSSCHRTCGAGASALALARVTLARVNVRSGQYGRRMAARERSWIAIPRITWPVIQDLWIPVR